MQFLLSESFNGTAQFGRAERCAVSEHHDKNARQSARHVRKFNLLLASLSCHTPDAATATPTAAAAAATRSATAVPAAAAAAAARPLALLLFCLSELGPREM